MTSVLRRLAGSQALGPQAGLFCLFPQESQPALARMLSDQGLAGPALLYIRPPVCPLSLLTSGLKGLILQTS